LCACATSGCCCCCESGDHMPSCAWSACYRVTGSGAHSTVWPAVEHAGPHVCAVPLALGQHARSQDVAPVHCRNIACDALLQEHIAPHRSSLRWVKITRCWAYLWGLVDPVYVTGRRGYGKGYVKGRRAARQPAYRYARWIRLQENTQHEVKPSSCQPSSQAHSVRQRCLDQQQLQNQRPSSKSQPHSTQA
jgi:hypothetical protein